MLLLPFSDLVAQSTFKEAILAGDKALKRGDFEQALKEYFAAEAFEPSQRGLVRKKLRQVFDGINTQRIKAIESDTLAQRARREAVAAREKEGNARIDAEKKAVTNYANELAYLSEVALLNGDLNSAFRLAEFILKYVEEDNSKAQQALFNAFYWNDDLLNFPLARHKTFMGHKGIVNDVCFSPDGSLIASASEFNEAKIWDVESGALVQSLVGHKRSVSKILFAPHGNLVLTASSDNTIRIWDVSTGDIVNTLEGHTYPIRDMKISPNGLYIASCSNDGTSKVWEIETGKLLRTLKNYRIDPSCLDFSPDGRFIAANCGRIVVFWEIQSGVEYSLISDKAGINDLAYSPDGKVLVTANVNSSLVFWDADNKEKIDSFRAHDGYINSVNFSPSGKYIVTGSFDQTAKIWSFPDGEIKRVLRGHDKRITSACFSSDEKHIVTGSYDGSVKLWELEPENENVYLEGVDSWVSNMQLSKDGKKIIGSCDYESITVWDSKSGKVRDSIGTDLNIPGIWCLSLSGESLFGVVAKDLIKGWDIQSKKEIWEFSGEEITGIGVSPNGKYIVVISSGTRSPRGKKLEVWDMKSNKQLATIEFSSEVWEIRDPVFSKDGNFIYAILYKGKYSDILNWEWQTSGENWVLSGHLGTIGDISLAPNDSILVSISVDETAKIWNLRERELIQTFFGEGDKGFGVSFSPTGEMVATSFGNEVRVKNAESGQNIYSLKGINSSVYRVDFFPEGKRVITRSEKYPYCKIWDVDKDRIIQRWHKNGWSSFLSKKKLLKYQLGGILDINAANESKLIASNDVWQIKAFADLIAMEAKGGRDWRKVEPLYKRSNRLYEAILEIEDVELIRKDYAKMLHFWAGGCSNNGFQNKADSLRSYAFEVWMSQ